MVQKFICQYIIYRFGIPRRLISDNGRQFAERKLKEWCEEYDIQGNWVDELPGVLWAIRTTPKEGTGVTPFHLVYDGEAVVPVEVGVESNRIQHYNEDNAEWRLLELDFMDETRDKVAVWLMAYRQRMRQNYNRQVISRSFQVGDLVWKKVKLVGDITKLEASWPGPFKVVEKLRSGATT
ncbi:uncharacterized protein LOC121969120 [Zingiber officinale]|uniref:uncharacterized protein LOC121969120 n=1 Tax=Zingiber officinale TaxID=94328 RepID=UPI001C4CCE76|nr:uncharacterized protein LOC121969120 [Zingiber officinale]